MPLYLYLLSFISLFLYSTLSLSFSLTRSFSSSLSLLPALQPCLSHPFSLLFYQSINFSRCLAPLETFCIQAHGSFMALPEQRGKKRPCGRRSPSLVKGGQADERAGRQTSQAGGQASSLAPGAKLPGTPHLFLGGCG